MDTIFSAENSRPACLAQIGCGYWGPNILRSLLDLPGCRLKWLVEQSPSRRRFVAEKFPAVAISDSIDDVLADADVDAVVLATPAGTHAGLAAQCLRAGKHVLVEKPLATSVADVDMLAGLARDNQRLVMAGHTFLFNPAVKYIKSVIDSGDLGKIRYFYSHRLNLGQVRTDVNVWWNLAPHDISIMLYLMGEVAPERIDAYGASYLRENIEDVAFANLQWPDGVVGHIHVSWLDPQKVRRMAIIGSRKMLIYDDMADQKVTILDKGYDEEPPRIGERMDFDIPNPRALVQRSGEIFQPSIDWQEPLKAELHHFLDCIRDGKQPLTGIAHAREVVRILQDGDASMKQSAQAGGSLQVARS